MDKTMIFSLLRIWLIHWSFLEGNLSFDTLDSAKALEGPHVFIFQRNARSVFSKKKNFVFGHDKVGGAFSVVAET
jgi:hypothetical protein